MVMLLGGVKVPVIEHVEEPMPQEGLNKSKIEILLDLFAVNLEAEGLEVRRRVVYRYVAE